MPWSSVASCFICGKYPRIPLSDTCMHMVAQIACSVIFLLNSLYVTWMQPTGSSDILYVTWMQLRYFVGFC